MKTKKEERAIIFRAVNEAVKGKQIDRHNAARDAAIIANRRGVNVQSAPYLQEIFIEALDKKEREGAFVEEKR